MADYKYSHYFLHELPKEQRERGFGRMSSMVAFTDADAIKDSQYFSVMIMGLEATKMAGHGPHIHQDPELLVALGTDPDNPHDLGAEMEICMGPEMESHIISESTMIYIPANFIHCPFRILKLTRPFLFIQCQYAPKLTETPLKKLVPEELRDKMVFIDTDSTGED